jgi:hypothetical protein
MISLDKEYFSSPYYFFLKERNDSYSLYFSSESTLVEARKKDKEIKIPKEKLDDIKKYLEKILKVKKKKSTEEVSGEIEELVNGDGGLMNSKIPILDPKMHPRKTMDQTVAMTRQTNDLFGRGFRGYRTFFGESDMSDAFGYEETKDLDGKETFKYYKDELEMEPEDAKERTKQQGKDPSGKKDKKSKYYNDKNFITRATISELQKQKAIKVVEDILVNKKNQDKSDVGEKDSKKEVSPIIKKNIKTLLKQMEKEGMSKKDIIKMLGSE